MAPLAIFAAMAIMFGFALQSGDPSKIPSALVGKAAPAYAFPALAGVEIGGAPAQGIAPGDLVGGGVKVVNFWASWCGPCVQEHPYLMALKDRGVTIFGVNHKDPAPGGVRFLGRHGNPYTRIGTDANGRGAIEWGVYGMPETFVVDAGGRIVMKHVGPIDGRILQDKILPAIQKAGGGR